MVACLPADRKSSRRDRSRLRCGEVPEESGVASRVRPCFPHFSTEKQGLTARPSPSSRFFPHNQAAGGSPCVGSLGGCPLLRFRHAHPRHPAPLRLGPARRLPDPHNHSRLPRSPPRSTSPGRPAPSPRRWSQRLPHPCPVGRRCPHLSAAAYRL